MSVPRSPAMVRTAGRPSRPARLTAALAIAVLLGTALAQVRVRVEVPYGVSVGIASLAGATAGEARLVAGVRFDGEARLDPLRLTLRLEPSLTGTDATSVPPAGSTSEPQWDAGLEEAYALLRLGAVDASAGLERLPLETARLTVPYQVDRSEAGGRRLGVLGARASLYLDPLRLRAAFLDRDGSLGGALSVRADLTSAQLEAHAVYLDGLALGVGASGTVADTVLYGEGWLLAAPWRGRGALGASGYLGDALWTTELAFAPLPGAAGSAAVPQLAAQVSVPLGLDATLEAHASAAWAESVLVPGAHRLAAQGALTWVGGTPDVQLELGPAVQTSELGTHYALTLRLTSFTAF